MKRLLFIATSVAFLLLFHSLNSFGQKRSCGTVEYNEKLLLANPGMGATQKRIKDHLEKYQKESKNKTLDASSLKRIPVVVHIVYNLASENISVNQVLSQLQVLNEDFRNLNADRGNRPTVFNAIATDAEIDFCLATQDPFGNPSTGITRTQTTAIEFTDNDAVKKAIGQPGGFGHDAWPTDKYLNIWVCNLKQEILGYATEPGALANVDGVVIDYAAFGKGGSAQYPYDQGRTTTHEVGHWLGLKHIWGDDRKETNKCVMDDGVADTPPQSLENYGCPAFPHISCSNGPNGDMFMNYMDYVDDACMNMFSNGQGTIMKALLDGGHRSTLANSNGCSGSLALLNDNCPDAISLPVELTCIMQEYTSIGATLSPGVTSSCSGNPDDDVWFSFRAIAGKHEVKVQGLNTYDAVVEVRDGNCNGTSIACSNSQGAGGTETLTLNTLLPGKIYYIRIYHSASGNSGSNFKVCVTYDPVTPDCNNIDFESNSLLGWQATYGLSGTPPYRLQQNGPDPLIHNITSPGVDPFTNSVNTVRWGNHSFLLGTTVTTSDRGGRALTRQMKVQPGNTNLVYSFAAFQNFCGINDNPPSDFSPIQKVEIIDDQGNLISCGSIDMRFDASGMQPDGFIFCPPPFNRWLYRPWTDISVDLSNYVNKTITLRFSSSDCSAFAHQSYMYFDAVCGPPLQLTSSAADNTVCNDAPITLYAPSGASSCTWSGPAAWPGNSTTGNSVTTTIPGFYTAAYTMPGFSCTFYATLDVKSRKLQAYAGTDVTINCGDTIPLGTSPVPGLIYTWSPNIELSSNTVAMPLCSAKKTTTYTLTVKDPVSGCEGLADVKVTVLNAGTINLNYSKNHICLGDVITITADAGPGYTYNWYYTNASGIDLQLTNVNPLTVTARTNMYITVEAVDVIGCSIRKTFLLPVNVPAYNVQIAPGLNVCNGGLITFNADNPDLQYNWDFGFTTATGAFVQAVYPQSVNDNYTVTGTDIGGCTTVKTFKATNNCYADIPPGQLNSNPAPNTYCASLANQEITIEAGVTIRIRNSELCMAPGSAIRVKNGGVLYIESSHLYSCVEMWQGIIVDDGGRLIMQSSSNLNRSVLIEDAIAAVSYNNYTSPSPIRPIFSADNVIFNRNKVGVLIQDYAPPATGVKPFQVSNCLFTSVGKLFNYAKFDWPNVAAALDYTIFGNLTPKYNRQSLKTSPNVTSDEAGIKLVNAGTTTIVNDEPLFAEVELGEALLFANRKTNYFENLTNGILAISSNFSSVNNQFGRCHETGIKAEDKTARNYGLRIGTAVAPAAILKGNNVFKSCETAIFSVDYLGHDIRNVEIEGLNKRGIYISTNRYKKMLLRNNTLRLSIGDGIMIDCTSGNYSVGSHTAVNGQYSGSIEITENICPAIYLNHSGVGTLEVIDDANIFIHRNRDIDKIAFIDWKDKKIDIQRNLCKSIDFDYCSSQSGKMNSIWNNTIDASTNGFTGISVSDCDALTVSENKLSNLDIGVEFNGWSTSTEFRCNNFRNFGRAALYLSINGEIGEQGSLTNPTGNTWDGTYHPINGPFKTETFGATAKKSILWVDPRTSRTNPNGFGKTTGTTNEDDYFNNGSSLSTLKYSIPGLSTCLPINPNTNPQIGPPQPPRIPVLEQILTNTPKPPYFPDLTQPINQKLLYELLSRQQNLINSSALLRDFFNQNSFYKTVYKLELALADGNYNQALVLLLGITAQNPIEKNYLDFYTLYIDHKLNPSSPVNFQRLFDLAYKCPFTDGAVVFQARSLYNTLKRTHYPFQDNCPAMPASLPREGNSIAEKRNFELQLYPNPLTGTKHLQITTGSSSATVNLNIVDITGKLLQQEVLTIENGQAELLLTLQSGIYQLIFVNKATEERLIKKLVIQ